MKKYYSYIYLDSIVIDDLYPQVFDEFAEKNVTYSNEDISNVSLNSNILNILGSSIDKNENSIFSDHIKIVTSTAKKAQLLIDHFKGDETSISKIIQKNIPFSESIFFVGKSTFFLRDILNKTTGKSLFVSDAQYRNSQTSIYLSDEYVVLTDDAVFVLETGDDEYIYRYKRNMYEDYSPSIIEIMMHLSNIKIRKDIRHLTSAIQKRRSFDFYVFGELIHTNDNFYKISPFAVWQ